MSFSNRAPPITRVRSHRLPRPTTVSPPAVYGDANFLRELNEQGLSSYVSLFEKYSLTTTEMKSLSNRELRDELGISKLAHRRLILSLIHIRTQPRLPIFGAILVHLSNVRTFHSWLSSAFQAVVLSLALTRLFPLRGTDLLLPASSLLMGASVLYAVYGAVRFFLVTRTVESGERYTADYKGIIIALVASIATAAITIVVILIDGFAVK